LTSLLLKQILMYDAGYDVPTSLRDTLFLSCGLKTMPYFLFTKEHVFVQNQLEDLFLKYKQYFRIPWWCFWRFLKIFLLFRSCYICYFVMWDHWRFYEDFIHVTCVSRRKIFFRWIFLFVKYIFKRDFEKYISEEYLFQYIYEKNIWYKYMLILWRKSPCCWMFI